MTEEKNKRLLCEGLKNGPNLRTIRRALNQALLGHHTPMLLQFGNGYRDYPIEITGFKDIKGSEKNMTMDIFGKTNYREHRPGFLGSKILIHNYCPHSRTADKMELLD